MNIKYLLLIKEYMYMINKEYKEWPGHGGYSRVSDRLKDRSTSMPYDAKEVIECLYSKITAQI